MAKRARRVNTVSLASDVRESAVVFGHRQNRVTHEMELAFVKMDFEGRTVLSTFQLRHAQRRR